MSMPDQLIAGGCCLGWIQLPQPFCEHLVTGTEAGPYQLIVGPASLSAFKPEVAAFTANDNHCPFSDT